jgi:hypothetical protein
MNINYKNLNWVPGSINLPGIKEKVYAIAKSKILAWPKLPVSSNDTMGPLATYVGDFTLADGEVWHQVGVIVDKSSIDGKSQGSKPSKTSLNTGTFLHPGTDEEATAFCLMANNDDLVYMVQTKTGKWRVIGNEMFSTETAFEQKSGSAPTDEMGTTLTITVTDICPAPFYVGQIATVDGIINEAADNVAEVTFTPDGGNVTVGTTTITLTSATAAAVIKYKIGSGAWTTYAAPIATTGWTGAVIVTAKATKVGLSDSDYTSATFHV